MCRFGPSIVVFDRTRAAWGSWPVLGLALILSAREKPPVAACSLRLAADRLPRGIFHPRQVFLLPCFSRRAACRDRGFNHWCSGWFANLSALRRYSLAFASAVYLVALVGAGSLFFAGFEGRSPDHTRLVMGEGPRSPARPRRLGVGRRRLSVGPTHRRRLGRPNS